MFACTKIEIDSDFRTRPPDPLVDLNKVNLRTLKSVVVSESYTYQIKSWCTLIQPNFDVASQQTMARKAIGQEHFTR
jgi:hypothetical protein